MADPLLPDDPTALGAYTLEKRLGEGGQGVVYAGRDGDGRQVAVKLLHARLSDDPSARTRFVRELEAAERVAPFCTARILDADVDGDRPYIVSEFVSGPSLAALVRDQGPMDAPALLRLAVGTATALAAVHRGGIVHRDFKPANVLMAPDGPRVIDFGVARALDHEAVTVTGQIVGTPAYMAPEQIAGGTVGPATDMFAWAATMVFAATGRAPFGGDSVPAVLHQVLHGEADVRALPAPLAELAAICLAKDPARRLTAPDLLLRLLDAAGARPGPDSGDLLEHGATMATAEHLAAPPPPPPAPVPTSGPPPTPWTPQAPGGPARRPTRVVGVLAATWALIIAGVVGLGVAGVPLIPGTGGIGASGDAERKTVDIGVLGPFSGDLSTLGQPMLAGARLAVDEYNASRPRVRARLMQYDTGGKPEGATLAATRARTDGVAAVIGPMTGQEAMPAGQTLESAGIPSVTPSVADRTLTQRGWRYWHSVVPVYETRIAALADLALTAAPGTRKAVLIADGTAATTVNADPIERHLRGKRVTVRRVTEPPGSTFTRAIDAIKKEGADTVFFSGYFPESARLLKNARQAGVKARFYLPEGSQLPNFVEMAGRDAAEGTVTICGCLDATSQAGGTTPPAYNAFAQRYAKANGGSQPGTYAAEAYDAATAVTRALAQGRSTPQDINAYLGTIDVQGVTQRIKFGAGGALTAPVIYAYQVKGGRFVSLGDARTARVS
ncbi:bifunctional serine/threonine-protein kinase/ABC transporter substrate-binding protein [Actinomadura miaoliensis]|uniref:Protein kinase domain-containing protein n=1 Tax=Actinomadura miaoliensis TaxID=430685 RepID=A0ABP7WGF9_9ACTN